jgi:oxygen-independent coproporphyrinogen-3 oxidase
VGDREAFEESIFLGLRMNDGIELETLRKTFPKDLVAPCEEAAQELIADGLMNSNDNRWSLTLRGRLVSNDVFGHLLEGVAE